ncbi:MAG: hypothetical protein AAF430_17300 [Myxococcota bacterium]
MSPRRRILLGLLGLVVAGVLAVWALGRAPASEGEPTVAAAPPPAEAPAPGAPEGEAAAAGPLPPAVERYLAATVYPPTSGALADTAVDLLEPNRRYERMRPVPGAQGTGHEFLWTADRYRYTSDQTVRARFEALDGGQPAEIRVLSAFAQAEGRGGPLGSPVAMTFRAEADARTADLELERVFADHHGPVRLVARYALGEEPPQEETIRIFVTPADRVPAEFTGRFGEAATPEGLVVRVGVDVFEPGFYRIDANLLDAGGEPLAWGVFKGDLEAGPAQVPLRFFGKVLVDRGRAGPYRVAQLRGYLFRDGSYPDRLEMRPYPGIFETQGWSLAAFSDAEWDSPERRRMVELLLEDERRGIGLDVPGAPAGLAPAPAPADSGAAPPPN